MHCVCVWVMNHDHERENIEFSYMKFEFLTMDIGRVIWLNYLESNFHFGSRTNMILFVCRMRLWRFFEWVWLNLYCRTILMIFFLYWVRYIVRIHMNDDSESSWKQKMDEQFDHNAILIVIFVGVVALLDKLLAHFPAWKIVAVNEAILLNRTFSPTENSKLYWSNKRRNIEEISI